MFCVFFQFTAGIFPAKGNPASFQLITFTINKKLLKWFLWFIVIVVSACSQFQRINLKKNYDSSINLSPQDLNYSPLIRGHTEFSKNAVLFFWLAIFFENLYPTFGFEVAA